MNKKRLAGVVFACVFILFFGPGSHAAPVQYVYTGNTFDSNDGTYPLCNIGEPGCFNNITATITLSAEPGGNFIFQDIVAEAWSISDGLTTITDQSTDFGLVTPLRVGTDASGNIIQWVFDVARINTQPLGALNELRTVFGAGVSDVDDTRYCTRFTSGSCSYTAVALVDDNPGTWSVATVPLPAAVWLFGSGLLGLVGVAGQRRQS